MPVPVVSEHEAPAALLALPEGTSIVAIGPPSNLVKAAAMDPGFPARVSVRVVGCVTSRLRHPLLAFFDLNFRHDPTASAAFWRLPWRSLRVFPLDVVKRLRLDGADLDQLAAASPLGSYLARHSIRWLRRAHLVHLSGSFPVWDLPAALDAAFLLEGASWDEGPPAVLRGFNVEAARDTLFRLVG